MIPQRFIIGMLTLGVCARAAAQPPPASPEPSIELPAALARVLIMLFDIGYADGLTPALAMPERPLPDGARAG